MKTKRFLSILLSLVLVLGMFPGMSLTAYAADTTTTITPGTDDAKTGTGTMTITLKIKAAQTITASDVTATYGDTDKSVSASVTTPATGGGAISYTVKDGSGNYIDVASDGKLTIKKVPASGNAYVIVKAAETDDYAETTKEVTVTISKAEATVAAKDQGIMVGGTVPDLSAPVLNTHYSVTGLVGTDALTTAPTLAYQKNGSAATPDNTTAGTYDIVPSGASAGDNYNISYTNGTLTITAKDAQTITASDITATYGDTDKSVSASTDGNGEISYSVKAGSEDYIGVASDGKLTIKKVPADGKAYVTVTAAETTTGGTGGNGYAAATKEVVVTISKATVTVAAENQSIYVNGTVPDLSAPVLDTHYTVTGLVGEDTLMTAPTLAYQKDGSAATPDNTTAGTYDIVPSGASAGDNYNISYTNGTLTISEKPTATVTKAPEAKTLTYTGSAQSLVTAGSAEGGEMQYALGTETGATQPYTTSIPTATDAGTYYVWYNVKGDANHKDTDPNHVSVTIAKKTLTITAGDQTIEHDGEIATGTDLATAATLAQGDTLTAVTLTPGEGKITPSAAKIMNGQTDRTDCYEITYVDGTLTVKPAPAPAPSGGGSSTPATVTIPVSSEDGKTSVNVTVQVSGSTATVTSADVDKVLEAKDVGNVTVNVESLNKTVDEVVLPAALVEKVAAAVANKGNDASGLEIKLPTGTVTFDATTVATLAKQSDGKDLKVHLDNVSQATLTSAQQTTVKDMNALVVLDAYVTADGKRISNFNGGKATFSVPVELKDGQVPEGVTAFFVDDNGDKTEIPCSCDGKTATGTVEHFSNYVITYDESRVTKPEPQPEPEPEPTPGPATPTDIGYDDLSDNQKKDADAVASALGVDKDTAAQMVKLADELGVSIDTVKLSGAALAKMNVDSSDPAGTDFGKLTARVTKRTNAALTLQWAKQKKADGYLIYGNKCGKGNKMKLLKTIKKNGTVSYTQKKLKKGTYYKYMVVAYKNVNGRKMPIAASVVLHAPTKGSKTTVAKSVKTTQKVKKQDKAVSSVSVKKGKSVTIKVTENKEDKKLKIKSHRKVKFESSDKKIATVNCKGKITGKKKGKATVWAYAQNGIFKAIQVTVK